LKPLKAFQKTPFTLPDQLGFFKKRVFSDVDFRRRFSGQKKVIFRAPSSGKVKFFEKMTFFF
jgi:hypothetical protein